MLRPTTRAVGSVVAVAMAICVTLSSATAALIDLTPIGSAVNSVGSISLADLQNDPTASIVVGDKVFTGFSYSRSGDMPVPNDVLVLGFKDLNGNYGVSFHGTFIDLVGSVHSDALIRFTVTADPSTLGISNANLFVGGVGVGDESTFTVDETFLGRNETMNAYLSTVGPGTNSQLNASTAFSTPVASLTVTKGVFALAAQSGFLPARATVIDQSFATAVPEPAAMALVGMSGLAMVAVRRRK